MKNGGYLSGNAAAFPVAIEQAYGSSNRCRAKGNRSGDSSSRKAGSGAFVLKHHYQKITLTHAGSATW